MSMTSSRLPTVWLTLLALGASACFCAVASAAPPDEKKDEKRPLAGPRNPPPPPDAMDEEDEDEMSDFPRRQAPRPPRVEWDRSGRGPHRGAPRDGIPPDFRLSDEQIATLLEFAREYLPEHAARLERLREDDPAMYRRALRRLAPHLFRMKEVYDRDPRGIGPLIIEDFKLEERVREFAERYRQAATDTDKTAAAAELRAVLVRQWEVRMERRRLELAELERRLAEQRERLEQRAARRDEMIQRQFDRLTGEGDWDW
jgi:hypothetical protein